jgi:L-threonylcarbamoyladenylate synthase
MILSGDRPESIADAVRALAAGELVGMPTETVYGLAADACNDDAVAKIFAAKGRPSDHPLIVHVASTTEVSRFARHIPKFAQSLMDAFWPGPLTLILPRRSEVGATCAGGQDSIGLRCPSHPVALALLKACADAGIAGLAAPSANQFGRISPTTAAHVQAEMGDDLLILDGGACTVGIESTIIDCTRGAPVLLRPGVLTRAQLASACGCPVLERDAPTLQATAGPRASGTLASHYAPNATLRLMDAQALQAAATLLEAEMRAAKIGAPKVALYSRVPVASSTPSLLQRRMPNDAAQTARELFAVLRDFDARGVKLIWVETPPASSDWDGVRDRLQRAAS